MYYDRYISTLKAKKKININRKEEKITGLYCLGIRRNGAYKIEN